MVFSYKSVVRTNEGLNMGQNLEWKGGGYCLECM